MSNPGFSDRAQEPFGDIPTEPEAFLLWSSQRRREEGKFELSRGRVRRTEPYATRAHARVCTNIFGELARSLDDELFDVGLSGFGVRTPVGIRSPDVLVDPVNAGSDAACDGHASLHCRSLVAVDHWHRLHGETPTSTRRSHPCKPISSAARTSRAPGSGRGRATASWPKLPTELAGRERRDRARRPGRRAFHGRHLSRHPRRADARLIAPCSRSASSPAST